MKIWRDKKLVLIFGTIFLIIICSVVCYNVVLGYDTTVAHPNIARLAAELYNEQFDKKLSEQEIRWIEQGAEDEDVPIRWMNHFYDPVNNKGLWFGKSFLNAKIWADTSKEQNSYALGDQSWSRALCELSKGNKKEAMIALGHVVHLLSDMTVPAHTRNDIHPSGDSYEQYIKINWDSLYPQIKDKIKYRELDNLESAFDVLAGFSNGYFYSDDTVGRNYVNPGINSLKVVFEKNADGVSYKYVYGQNNVRLCWVQKYSYLNKDEINLKDCTTNFPSVITSYTTQLLPKSIGYSAGLIKLFFSEAEKGNQGKNVALAQTTPTGYAATALGYVANGAISLWDTISGKVAPAPARSEDATTLSTGEKTAEISQNIVENTIPVAPQNTTPITRSVVVTPVVPTESVVPVMDVPSLTLNDFTDPVVVPEPVVPVVTPSIIFYTGGGGSSGSSGGGTVTPDPIITETTTTSDEIVTPTSTTDTPTTTTETTTTDPNTSTSTDPFVTSTDPGTTTTTINIPTSTPETPTTTTSTVDVPTTTPETSTTTPTSTVDVPTTTPSSTSSNTTMEVVINEIAWAGTSADYPTHEWVELYNNTDQDISLFTTSASTTWKLKVGDWYTEAFKIYNPTIPAHGYYLMEFRWDETVREAPADYTFALNGGFPNAGAKVQLIRPDGSLSDVVDCSGGWFAGSENKYQTMERLNPLVSGSEPTNWQTNKGQRLFPRTYNGGQVYGSPKLPNTGGMIALNVYQDDDEVVLTKDNSPYILGFYNIRAGKKLTIEPGVVIKSYYTGSRFDVFGTLQINGTADEPVVFTSGRDLSRDTVFYNQVSSGEPTAKDWQGIWFHTGSIGNINNLDMRYAGKEFRKDGYIYTGAKSEAIRAEGANLNIQNSKFLHNGDKFIYALNSSNLTVENSVFADGGLAIQVDGGSANLNNNEFVSFTTDPPTQVLILP